MLKLINKEIIIILFDSDHLGYIWYRDHVSHPRYTAFDLIKAHALISTHCVYYNGPQR